ncbi:hypothetical protein HanXRQr2_Chr12g0561431 [Helianthus annuus]|uniref:Uncharacterized protein n=1 Tax=Helianthus annuus TaxID=4232 RepID=A0A9K3HJM0_HELAN|nr:hypothetical protein HanXRQr2_Chr12g0561431 [Helianthus annuus]KAJ0864346.1 hypothetical protein HanPSC8_Chr12g0540861 [Helianthus annuus]
MLRTRNRILSILVDNRSSCLGRWREIGKLNRFHHPIGVDRCCRIDQRGQVIDLRSESSPALSGE